MLCERVFKFLVALKHSPYRQIVILCLANDLAILTFEIASLFMIGSYSLSKAHIVIAVCICYNSLQDVLEYWDAKGTLSFVFFVIYHSL